MIGEGESRVQIQRDLDYWRLALVSAVLNLLMAEVAFSDVYKFVGKSGGSYYAAKAIPGKNTGIPPRPRDVFFVMAPVSIMSTSRSDVEQRAPDDVNRWIELAAHTYDLDPKLLHAVISAESSYNPYAISSKGAAGLMQLMPATAARFNVSDRLDARENILGGSRYLSSLLGMFDHDVELALAAYNAGEGNVIRYGRKIPPFTETQSYVAKVLGRYRH